MINKKVLLIFFILTIILSFTNSITAQNINNENIIENNEENIHIVDGSAYNQMSNPTIQNAIDNANSGDTILINGTDYVHCHFVINKQLTIKSDIGTVMTTCPSNTDESRGVGIFYFGEGASGSLLSGFTLINEESKRDIIDPYSVYIKSNSNVTISNCTFQTSDGPGIFIHETNNTLIKNNQITNSKNGILIQKSSNIQIINNNIEENSYSGINIGFMVSNSFIFNNTIHANDYYGIFFNSSLNAIVKNNKITDNRNDENQQRASEGSGIYVDCNITNMQIIGNFISENGNFGIYNTDNVQNLINQYVQVINNNYFVSHKERVAYHSVNGQTGPIYFWSNYYSLELFCGGSAYAPGVLIGTNQRQLVMSDILQIEKGIYSVSFIRKDTGEIASDLNSVELIFFLNKIDRNPTPSDSDIYKIIEIINGTAIVDFRDIEYLPSANNLTVIGPGMGSIDYSGVSNRPVQFLKINDSEIPSSIGTILIGTDLNITDNENIIYSITLTDYQNKALPNKAIIFEINNQKYNNITNNLGIASIKINLNRGIYNITAIFEGDSYYEPSNTQNKIIITNNKTFTLIIGSDLIQNYGDDNSYNVNLKDINNNPIINQNIKITINGIEYVKKTDNNGNAKLTIRLNPGTYEIKAIFEENDLYLSSSIMNNILVNDPSKIGIITFLNGNDLNQNFGENKAYSICLTDLEGNFLANQLVKIIINGIEYAKTTDNNGNAKLIIRLKPGTYSVNSIYDGNNLYDGSLTYNQLEINENNKKIDVNIIFENEQQIFGENKALLIKLIDNELNPLKNQNIYITVNDVIYERISDEEGIARLIIRLNPGNYAFSINYLGNNYYNSFNLENVLKISENRESKISAIIQGYDLNQTFGENKEYLLSLKDGNGNNLSNQNIKITVNGVEYIKTTNDEGIAKLTIRLNPGIYSIKSEYIGNSLYSGAIIENNLRILKKIIIPDNLNNLQIQNIINIAEDNSILIFIGTEYENISLNINKPLKITSRSNTILKGDLNKIVLTIKSENVIVSNLNILTRNSTGILIENSYNIEIIKNNINSLLDESKIEKYMKAIELLDGNGIEFKNSKNVYVLNNNLSLFYSGIHLKDSTDIKILDNLIHKNNYGIIYDFNVSNTLIRNNDILDNIGLITMDFVEGPVGYGIYLKNSASNVEILSNNILNNYIGIFIDSKNSTGIKIVENLISNSTLEGLVFYVNYTIDENAIEPIVENNAIFNNAKGPGLIILGEISANPEGIYGPGEFDNNLRLKLGSNWYGTNEYIIWSENGTQGAGTICPRINTTLITFNISYFNNGSYKIIFYNNEKIANLLPEFKIFATLNYLTGYEIEKEILITNGEGIINFNNKNYKTSNNLLEISCGSLNDSERTYYVIYTYKIPNNEIPK